MNTQINSLGISNRTIDHVSNGARNTSKLVSSFVYYIKIFDNISVCSEEKTVMFNGSCLDLHKQKKIYTLFHLFSKHREEGLDRFTLIREIYHPNQEIKISNRQLSCYDHNIVKLLSRARNIATHKFNTKYIGVDWFPYNIYTKKWDFYRVSSKIFHGLLFKNKS